MTAIRLPLVSAHPLWGTAQHLGVLLTVALLVALVRWPDPTLHLLWDMVIPLLPATFLVSPTVWRNVCPLATLNDLGGRRRAAPGLSTNLLGIGWMAGLVLLLLMVPARRFLFNEHGLILALTITGVAGLALGAGFLSSRRSGFCNSLCPVLPVEKLYGQSPLLAIGTARCADCNRCTPAGCIDLSGRRSMLQSVSASRARHWLLSPLGFFAALFPGFVYGYFTTVDGGMATALATYQWIGLWSVVSLVAASVPVLVARVRAAVALPVLGGAAIAVYYWFAAPKLAEAYGVGVMVGEVLRVALLALVAGWMVRAVRREVRR